MWGIGAGEGAAASAGLGAIAGGEKGALIGAGIGAIAGGAVGNRLEAQAQKLTKVVAAISTENGILVNLKNNLLFDTGKSTLTSEDSSQVSQLEAIIAKHPHDPITNTGNTDNRGSASVNNMLSVQRAQAVQDVLVQSGVKPIQNRTEEYGASKPVPSNSSSSGRIKNRRVEVYIVDGQNK